MSIERGDTRRLTTTIRLGETPTDPAELTLTVRDPAGNTTVYTYGDDPEIVRESAGEFYLEQLLDQTGAWTYQWRSTDPSQVGGGTLIVVPAPLDLEALGLTLTGLKDRVGKELHARDPELYGYLAAAFGQAQAIAPFGCGRLLTPNPASDLDPEVQRTFKMTGRRVRIPDARTISQVLLDDVATDFTTVEQNDHIVAITLPRDPAPSLYPPAWAPPPALTAQREVKVTGRFGFLMIPPDLAEGIYVLAGRYMYEKAAQYADQVEILEGTAVQNYYRQLPDRTWRAFKTYAVPTGAGLTLR